MQSDESCGHAFFLVSSFFSCLSSIVLPCLFLKCCFPFALILLVLFSLLCLGRVEAWRERIERKKIGKMLSARSDASVVVGVDFGTTFSGYAYAHKEDPTKVNKVYHWPDESSANVKPYCKTQTSLFYVQDNNGKFQLQGWGWGAQVKFFKSAQDSKPNDRLNPSTRLPDRFTALKLIGAPSQEADCSTGPDRSKFSMDLVKPLNFDPWVTEKLGYFATHFKLFLAAGDDCSNVLPGDLTVERLIVDYLTCLRGSIMVELQSHYGKYFKNKDIEWCITVPAIWGERAKQVMKICAEKAGLVQGPSCPLLQEDAGSPHPLGIILEPEAASVYCQQARKGSNLKKGDRLLVADIGGGTIDLVVHCKVDDDPDSLRVTEVAKSYGNLGGGAFVDHHFVEFMQQKIGCFRPFCRENPLISLSISKWWQGIKTGFHGPDCDAVWFPPKKFCDAWELYDRSEGNSPQDDYGEFKLHGEDIVEIFRPEVENVSNLIQEQIAGIRVLMIVGGFAESPYLREELTRRFRGKVDEVIIPENPGGAICHGAVLLQTRKDIIQSRVARKTYGICSDRGAIPGDRADHLYNDDDGRRQCRDVFSVFVNMGEAVQLDRSVTQEYRPMYHGQNAVSFELYSCEKANPRYTTDDGAVLEGTFEIDISQDMAMDKERRVEVTMNFGGSSIAVTAVRKNFGPRTVEKGLTVMFQG